MGLSRLPTRDETLYRLGTISGAVRASTGYAFINIRKQTEQLALALATSLSRGASLPASLPKDPIPLWSRYADDIFLKALARSPALGQGIMSELLRRAPERDLVPFLSGSASMASGLRVITSVPKLNILKALWGQDA
jgi:lycopene beta-cyclase